MSLGCPWPLNSLGSSILCYCYPDSVPANWQTSPTHLSLVSKPVPFSWTTLFRRDPAAVCAGFIIIQFFLALVSQCFHFPTQPSPPQDCAGQVQRRLYRILTNSSLTLRPRGQWELLPHYGTFPLRNHFSFLRSVFHQVILFLNPNFISHSTSGSKKIKGKGWMFHAFCNSNNPGHTWPLGSTPARTLSSAPSIRTLVDYSSIPRSFPLPPLFT